MKRSALGALASAMCVCAPTQASAFPPYRSADATPPTPYELGVRLGVGRLQWDDGRSGVTAPLLRASLGLPDGFEVISQIEYSPRENRIGDAALGGKWATRVAGTVSVGVETFALLPVRPSTGGVGVETLFVATLRSDPYRLHLNAGGFHDPRAGPPQSGWRASALAEVVPRPGQRIGLEVFGKDSGRARPDLRAGVGLIHDLGWFDVRTAVHVGLSPAAPDVVTSLWFTTSFPLAR
jgi:hypothetical protein